MEKLQGQLLIASPELADPNFRRSVVLLIEHDENGAFGVVLNHPTEVAVRDVWEEVTSVACDSPQTVNVGGPVVGPLMAIHDQPRFSEKEVMPGIYLATSREHLDEIVRSDKIEFRLFSGYAGWGEGQLEHELKVGGWITRRATSAYIFSGDDLWTQVGRDITSDVYSVLDIKHRPDDPSLN